MSAMFCAPVHAWSASKQLPVIAEVSCAPHLSCIARNKSGRCSWQELNHWLQCGPEILRSTLTQGECLVLQH